MGGAPGQGRPGAFPFRPCKGPAGTPGYAADPLIDTDVALEDLYRKAVLDHNRQPRHYHRLADATHASRGLNALCGDDIQVYLVVCDGRIERASFTGEASAITMASASMMTEAVTGRTIEESRAIHRRLRRLLRPQREPDGALRRSLGELAALEGVRDYPSRAKSATLPWATLEAALRGEAVASTE